MAPPGWRRAADSSAGSQAFHAGPKGSRITLEVAIPATGLYTGPQKYTANLQERFMYNPTFESIYSIVPSVPALLLVLIPAILMAVSVVREKELGSIINFYVTPTGRLEYLLGKQLIRAPKTGTAWRSIAQPTTLFGTLSGSRRGEN